MVNQQNKMELDVRRIARMVARDIGIAPGMQTVDCFYLCERAGGKARHVILEPGKDGLYTEDREPGYDIFISLQLPLWTVPLVMIHELAHRFTAGVTSYRYDEFNTVDLAGYDRRLFLEAVAERVEALFLYCCYFGR